MHRNYYLVMAYEEQEWICGRGSKSAKGPQAKAGMLDKDVEEC
jgi:hypothetical protein